MERKADRLAGRAVLMGYHLILFSPATHEAFTASERRLVGVRARQQKAAARVEVGDKLLGYLTELSRWVGVLEVTGAMLRDSTPLFVAENDPYDVRLPVRTEVWLAPERGIPIKDAEIWGRLELVREYDPGQPTWTGKVRTSLVALPEADGRFLEERLRRQAGDGRVEYPLSEGERRKARTQHVQRPEGPVAVEVPEEAEDELEAAVAGEGKAAPRESAQIQALLAKIGETMGFRVWMPKADRAAVLTQWQPRDGVLLDRLPLNYDDVTLRTIELIDVLWLRGRAIVRAFEVEHTTAVYSGILRMADLLALQPNMDIKLHIVAPSDRHDKVMREIRRPVFSLLERGPLAGMCTLLDYEAVREIAGLPHLRHVADTLLEEYAEGAEV